MNERGMDFGGMTPQEEPKEKAIEIREAVEYPSSEEVEEELSVAMDGQPGLEVLREVDDDGLRTLTYGIAHEAGVEISVYTYLRNGDGGKPSIIHDELHNERARNSKVVSVFDGGKWDRK